MPELLVKQLHHLPGELGEEIAVHLAAQPGEAGGRDKARLALTSVGTGEPTRDGDVLVGFRVSSHQLLAL